MKECNLACKERKKKKLRGNNKMVSKAFEFKQWNLKSKLTWKNARAICFDIICQKKKKSNLTSNLPKHFSSTWNVSTCEYVITFWSFFFCSFNILFCFCFPLIVCVCVCVFPFLIINRIDLVMIFFYFQTLSQLILTTTHNLYPTSFPYFSRTCKINATMQERTVKANRFII